MRLRPKNTGNQLSTECSIHWADGESVRARKVVSRSNSRVTGKFPSIKVGRMVHWESQIERDAILLLDVDPEIVAFREQPARIVYAQDGELKEHYPDLYVETKTSVAFVEVKTDKDAEDLDVKLRTALLTRLLAVQGIGYAVLVESEIRKNPRLKNAQYIHRYGKQPIDVYEEERIRNIFLDRKVITWGDVHLGALGKYGVAHVCRLLMEGRVHLNMGTEWSEDMEVTLR